MKLALISTTFETKADAERIARLLLENNHIACAQISAPITSLYRWEGAIATETEYVLAVKTSTAKLKEVKEIIAEEHPYELPEILVNTSLEVNPEYLDWLEEEIS